MSKVTSEECVELVVKAKGGSPSDWKRRSKNKRGYDIVRVFENVKTGERCEVVESGGCLKFGAGNALRTFAVKVSKEELAGIIAHQFSKMEDFGGCFEGKPERGMDPARFLEETRFDGGKGLTPQVSGDLSVVQFDMENFEWQWQEAYEGFESVTGFRTTPGGLTFLGVGAGGDWECPMLYILYWDGTQLRGYIPTAGNTFNTDTMTAYGSEQDVVDNDEKAEKASTDNLRERFGVDDKDQASPDAKKIMADIDANIKFEAGASVPFKGMDDIDWDAIKKLVEEEEAEEKEFEKNQAARRSGCNCGSCNSGVTTRVIVTGQDQQPSQPSQSSMSIQMDPKVIVAELDAVAVLAQEFLRELQSLRVKVNAGEPASELAMGARDVVLRELVSRFVKATLAIEHMK